MMKFLAATAIVGLMTSASLAVRTSIGAEPLNDADWPQGSVVVVNHRARVSGEISDFQFQLEYRGDEPALQEVIELFAQIKWPQRKIIIRDDAFSAIGPARGRIDWTFILATPERWYRNQRMVQLPSIDQLPVSSYPAPRLEVYAGRGGIDWSRIKVPEGIELLDLRDAGKPDGVLWRAQAYDMVTSRPIEKVDLTLARRRQAVWEPMTGGQTDSSGECEIKSLPPGMYQITASAERYVKRTYTIPIPAKGTSPLMILLAPAVSIRASIVDASGAPAVGAQVTVLETVGLDGQEYPLPARLNATSDQHGLVSFEGLPRGYARFIVAGAGVRSVDSLRFLEMPGRDIKLGVVATGTLKGILLDRDGNPARGRYVNVRAAGDPIGKWGGATRVGDDGTFEFKNVPPGQYLVSEDPSASVASEPDVKMIEVKADQTAEVQVKRK